MFLWQREVRPGWVVAFTDSSAGSLSVTVPGNGAASAARRRLRQETGVREDFRFMHQVHGTEVIPAESIAPAAAPVPHADAMLSASLPLAVLVADCLPVVFLGESQSPEEPVIAAVAHAGRRGLAGGVLPATVDALRQRGAESIEAWIGPAICGSCYEVPAELREEVAAVLPGSRTQTSWGTPALDLPEAASQQLAGLGVPSHNLSVCTLEEPALFSHRRFQRERQGPRPAAEGRFAGVVYRR
ncbi:polyphenol oxidase family protein [Acaricomes phytoseiuli]|uniref:polyphenol oxidase family protein n=1 Tax=Acaricomes phytoseiuli TaxID=291968 RepID=UPI00037D9D6F|nr:polyphenol oxidase family protein [Acaricomes phytoseiuli]MCW1249555.1 polyphenol oxidase family protein [Acaricomes phytoseiuli]